MYLRAKLILQLACLYEGKLQCGLTSSPCDKDNLLLVGRRLFLVSAECHTYIFQPIVPCWSHMYLCLLPFCDD